MPLSSVVGASSILKPGVCTSSTRPAAPFEGQTIYETDTDQLLTYNGSGWKPFADVTASTNGAVLQVVSTTKTDTFTTTSTTFTDITGATATITPSSSANKILVMGFTFLSGQSGTTSAFVRLARGGTGILIGDSSGSRVQATSSTLATHGRPSFHILDSPATTSATTYSIQVRAGTAGTVYVNRTQGDADAVNDSGRFATSITVMEISG